MCDQFLLTLECCVHGFGRCSCAQAIGELVSFFFCPNSGATRSHGFLKCLAPWGRSLTEAPQLPQLDWHTALGGGEWGEGGWGQAGGNGADQACGQESEGGGSGSFSCSLLAEVLVLTAGGWDLSEPRGSGQCVCVRAHTHAYVHVPTAQWAGVKEVGHFAEAQGAPSHWTLCLESLSGLPGPPQGEEIEMLAPLPLPSPTAQSLSGRG